MRGWWRGTVVATVVGVATALAVGPAAACAEMATELEGAVTDRLPVVEQEVVASSLPLLPFSGRSSRVTVRTWGDLQGVVPPARLDFELLSWIGCRSPVEEWTGQRRVFQVDDSQGVVVLVPVTDVPTGGLTDEQAAALTAAFGPPVVAAPTAWQRVTATAWAWWPHVLALAVVALWFTAMFRLLRPVARAVARRREAREAAVS